MAKPQILQVRLSDGEKQAFQAAAETAGISLSSWVRERLRLAATNELRNAGQQIAFIETTWPPSSED